MSAHTEPTIDSWVAAQKQASQPLADKHLAAFKDLFSGTAKTPGEISELASRIAEPYIKPSGESPVAGLWFAIQDAVDKLPSQNDKLAALVIALQRLPDGKGVSGPEPWFSHLPEFDNHWTEWVAMSFGDLKEDDPNRQANRQAWVNQNSFMAKITAQAGGVEKLREERQRGGVCLRMALERTPWDKNSPTYQAPPGPMEDAMTFSDDEDNDKDEDGVEGGEEDDEEEEEEADPNTKTTVLDALVPAAAQWIIHCPRELYEKAVEGGEMDSEYDHNGTNFGTKKGWSLDRWAYWRKRFEEISNMENLEDSTRRIAKASVEKMDATSKGASM
ncbi:unnamed protein product [Clonostachys byssicola]|uniref:Uncharacterized protein n=1 Tax=Clonostachys byssicola TaxID=160290 RepID=A0A9N9U9D5_9HYPO|nr:unnamed protein product [Clonostachys byssicola]